VTGITEEESPNMAGWPRGKYMSDSNRRSQFAKQARMLKVLAHESRLMIVERLNDGECSVGDLRKLVGIDLSTVSKHLALLRAHGIVADRREGTTVYYRLLAPCVCNLFPCVTKVLKSVRGSR
jgi:DNA-binding transcriptional ArsR family regulator